MTMLPRDDLRRAIGAGLMTLGLSLMIIFLAMSARAFDNGQYGDVPEHIRSWFKSVRSPNGVPCCDIADGHRTDYEIRDDGYYIPVPGAPPGSPWMRVPPDVVVYNAGNPVGEAIVWIAPGSVPPYIRCFVPGGGV